MTRTAADVNLTARQIPLRWILPAPGKRRGLAKPGPTPLNVTDRLTELSRDIVQRLPVFAHVNVGNCLLTVTNSKKDGHFGLQARLTPMRLEAGSFETDRRGRRYRVPKYTIDGRELLYLVTVCVPRFLDLPFEEKLITVVHELYHIGERFDGDVRRHGGRCHIHTGSKKGYDAHMAVLVDDYLKTRPNPAMLAWLHETYAELWSRHGGLFGAVFPKPRLVAV
jgi:hypothetical protein